ncbi:oligosaccharide flippase family protein, partial [Paraglaciecola sp.]|uniref:oligosaccharide flippase family protein n=1 Tax=Paraglaciecola sp. TaxID=1920173 RepID=UPI003EF12EF8
IIAGYSLPNFESLIIAVIIGLYINTFLLCAKTKTFKLPTKLLSFDRKNIVVIKKFKQLPRFRLPHALINNLSQMAPLILLTYYFGIKEAGYFVLTRTVLMVPVNLLGKAVYDVSYPKLSADFSRKPITKYLYLSTFGLMACSLLPILLLVFFGEELFSFVFGDAWSTSGIYAGCIAIWFSFNISNRACIAAVTLLNLDKFLLKNGILNITLATSGFMACIHFGATDTTSLMVFFMMSVIAQISLISKVLIASKQHDKKHCKEFKT